MNLNEINISTVRLVLRGLELSDASAVLKYRSMPEIYKFQNWKPQTLTEVEVFIREEIAGQGLYVVDPDLKSEEHYADQCQRDHRIVRKRRKNSRRH